MSGFHGSRELNGRQALPSVFKGKLSLSCEGEHTVQFTVVGEIFSKEKGQLNEKNIEPYRSLLKKKQNYYDECFSFWVFI